MVNKSVETARLCRLQHQAPTSDEVGMVNRSVETGRLCRLQHQPPTSHEVGMQQDADTEASQSLEND